MRGKPVSLLVCAIGLGSSGCGVFFGDPIELFPSKSALDGGAVDLSPCVEQAQKVGGDSLTILNVPARNMAALVEGARTADLIWPGLEASTEVTVAMSNVQVFSVHSRANTLVPQHVALNQCADHVRIEASLGLKTADGRLNESVSKIVFTAFDASLAHATFTIEKKAFQGSYAPSSFGQRCFTQTTFSINGELGSTHGGMTDEFHFSCDDLDAGVVTSMAGGHWGADWQDQ